MTVHPERAAGTQLATNYPDMNKIPRTEPVDDVTSQEASRSKHGRGITWSKVSGGIAARVKPVSTSEG